MGRSYRGAGVIRWGAQDGKDGVNYLIMGWWSANIHYKLTDAGIPVVKVEDTSPDKFSVYKLTALQSTLGIFVASEWEKVKSADFVYMQDAYIERLQAVLITAEKIEALMIKTSNLEVLDGAKVGRWNIDGGDLSSDYASKASIRIEQTGGRFLRINDNINASMLGIRSDGGTALSIYTQGGSAGVGVSIAAQTGATAIKSSGSHQLYQRAGESWNSPGVLATLQRQLNNLSGTTTVFNQKWTIEPLSNISLYRDGRTIKLTHGLGHKDYVAYALINAGAAEIDTVSSDLNICEFNISGTYTESHQITIVIVGRNRT